MILPRKGSTSVAVGMVLCGRWRGEVNFPYYFSLRFSMLFARNNPGSLHASLALRRLSTLFLRQEQGPRGSSRGASRIGRNLRQN